MEEIQRLEKSAILKFVFEYLKRLIKQAGVLSNVLLLNLVMQPVMEKQKESKNQNDKARIQFDFSKESINKLDEIVETVNASTRAEVVRKSLTLFTQLLEAEQRGAQIILKEPDGSYIRLLPLF